MNTTQNIKTKLLCRALAEGHAGILPLVRRTMVAGVAGVAAMSTVMLGAPATASSDTGTGNKLASLEKSLVLVGTKWSGYIDLPAYVSADGQQGWTDPISTLTTCTGWYASKTGQIVTAGHCVDPVMGRLAIIDSFLEEHNAPADVVRDAEINWKVEGLLTGSPVVANVQVVQTQGFDGATITSPTTVQVVDFKPTDNGDLALLQVPDMTKETPPLIVANATPTVGDPVTSIGFPGDLADIADQSQLPRASFKSGTVSSQQVTPQGVTMLEVSDPLGHGMSGGPTVNQDGQVVGINDQITSDANFNFVTSTPDLRSFLVSHGVVLAQPSAPKSGISVLWYAIGGSVALLVALSAAVLAVIQRRRKRQYAVADAAPPQAYPAQGAAPTFSAGAVPSTPIVANEPLPVSRGQALSAPSYPADPTVNNGLPVAGNPAT